MSSHPYKNLPDSSFWSRSIGTIAAGEVDPVVKADFQIGECDRVATAGSCFAQHIARYLDANGFNYFVTESAHPIVPPALVKDFNYGVFSARFGNIYTSRQLLQLWKRVHGEFQPTDDVWCANDGSLIDPFRPQIQPGGFSTLEEYRADRAQHFASVRRMFAELDVFVFTLGLTECWVSSVDGAAFPLCPGVAGGTFDPQRYQFVNLSVNEVVADMLEFIDRLRQENPRAKIILTVSPVPLMATAENRHVLVSTTLSKSVLRVAAETISNSLPRVAYFPSYEIITGNFSRGRYYAEDLRSITEAGVSHVMRLFMKHYAGNTSPPPAGQAVAHETKSDQHTSRMVELVQVNCDEEALDQED